MAPRARPRPRNTRMDAAIDNMGRLGFQEPFVRLKVKELLNVYGGEDCWPFIEENAYQQLIEALIESSSEKAEDSNVEKGEGSHLQNNSAQEEEAPAAMTSNAFADSELRGPDAVQAVSDSGMTEAIEDVAPPESCPPPVRNVERDPPQSAEGDGNNWKDIRLDRSSNENETDVAVSNIANNLPAQIPAITSSSSTKAIGVQPANHHAIRRPCYGWLDCDEGELDFIYLTPAARQTPISSERSDGTTNKRTRRKSRWDMMPEDS